MTTLNKYASEILKKYRLHGCTDVTGFSFLGHLCEMVTDQATARIYKDRVPVIPEAPVLAEEFYITAAAQRNRNHVQDKELEELGLPCGIVGRIEARQEKAVIVE